MSHSNPEAPLWAVNLFGLSGYELVYANDAYGDQWYIVKRERRLALCYSFNAKQEFYEDRIRAWEGSVEWEKHSVPYP